MKKNRFSFIQQAIVVATILLHYSACRCTPPPTSQGDQNNTPSGSTTPKPKELITDKMIRKVEKDLKRDLALKHGSELTLLLDCLKKLKEGDTTRLNRSYNRKKSAFDGFTPLFFAVEYGYPEVIAALLQLGADPTIRVKSYGNAFTYIFKSAANEDAMQKLVGSFLESPHVDKFINEKFDVKGKSITALTYTVQMITQEKAKLAARGGHDARIEKKIRVLSAIKAAMEEKRATN